MAYDIFTIRSLAAELKELLVGRSISMAATQPDGLAFMVSRKGQVHLTGGPTGYLSWLPKAKTSRSDPEGPAQYLLGAQIISLEADRLDRMIRLRLAKPDRQGSVTYGQLVLELVPNQFSAILWSERTGKVLGVWAVGKGKKGPRIAVGDLYETLLLRPRLTPGTASFSDFIAAYNASSAKDPYKALARILPGMDAALLQHQLAGIPLEGEAADLTKAWEVLTSLYSQDIACQGYIWKEGGRSFFSALKPLQSESPVESFSTMSQIINRYIEINRNEVNREATLRRARRLLEQRQQSLKRKDQLISNELEQAERADELEHKGNVLLAQIHQVKAGLSEIELPDIYDISGSKRIAILLNPRRSPAANSADYLKRAKRYKRRLELLPARLKRIKEELAEIALLHEKLTEGTEGLDKVEEWYEHRGQSKKTDQKARSKGPQAHPRRYLTASGWRVWAGRNNRENDVLSHKIAAQNDIWFHAHGYPGSHVILRREGRKDEPSAQTLQEAAGLAAYWSKGRTAKKVPVVYTLAKYVTKPKGSPPGLALLKREKTLMVEPALLPIEDKGPVDGH